MQRSTDHEERLSTRQIAAIQGQAWTATYHHVAAHSAFYRRHFRKAGWTLKAPPPLSRLGELPPIDKEALTEAIGDFQCVPPQRVVDIVTTSGSTGRPLVWGLTEGDLERLARNEEQSFRCAGLTARDTVLLAVTVDRCFMAGLAYWLGLRRRGCAVVRVGPSLPQLHLELMRRVGATAIVGVPSFLRLLADKAAEAGVDLAAAGVRKLVCIGEPVRNQDCSLNPLGQDLERRWRARVFSTYGVTELAASLCECAAGRGGHLHPDLLYLEALDEAGRPVAEGEVGELTATTFGVEAMPLVRYRTGDYAALWRAPCRCGRRTLRVGPIVGRRSQRLKVKGTTLFPSTLKGVLDSVTGVTAYVVIARREAALADALEVRVVCAGDAAPVCRELRERFQAEARVTPQITLATAAEVEALQLPAGARKRQFFVDLRD